MSTTPLPIDQFAAKVRGKYPGAYDHLSDAQLVQKVVDKYPDYKEHIASFAPTQFEKDQANQPTTMDKLNEYAGRALAGAGLPTSISDIPHWVKNLTGQSADSEPFYAPIQRAFNDPSERNIVGAVPFIGPTSVSMSDDARAGNYTDALATGAGALAGAGMAGQIRPGLKAAKAEAIDALRTPDGKLTPAAKLGARAVGAGAIGAAGHMVGMPEAGIIGAVYGPSIADAILPDRPPTPNFHGGAYSDFAGESGKAVPIRSSPFFVGNNAAAYKAGLKGDAYAPPEAAESARQAEAATEPNPANVAVVPEPRAPLPSDRPGSAWSLTRTKGLPEAALRGQPGAADVLRQVGQPVVLTPRSGGFDSPNMQALRESLGITESVPRGNPSPYAPAVPAPKVSDSAFTPSRAIVPDRAINPQVEMPLRFTDNRTGIEHSVPADELDDAANALYGVEKYEHLTPSQKEGLLRFGQGPTNAKRANSPFYQSLDNKTIDVPQGNTSPFEPSVTKGWLTPRKKVLQ